MLYQREQELESCVRAFLEGRQAGFSDIAKLVASDVSNIAYRYVGNEEDAKDITQEVLFRIYTNLHSFRNASKLSTWIYRITVNASIDMLRRKKNLVSWDETQTPYAHKTLDNLAEVTIIDKGDHYGLLKQQIMQLPLRQKNVIILKHYQGLTISQISAILNCSQSTVKTHLCRAIQTLRSRLEVNSR